MGYRYIGSKARIADAIVEYIGTPPYTNSKFIDAFSGTGVVSEKAADRGWIIYLNDMMKNAVVMSAARLLALSDVPFIELGGYCTAIKKLNDLDGIDGFIWKEYSPASLKFCGIERKYFTEDNARKIDAVVKEIHEWKKNDIITEKEFLLLQANTISSINDVANIAGTYGCFLAKWTTQAYKDFSLFPIELRRESVAFEISNVDVFDLQSKFEDVVYLDPPYTKRQYASYYHILETVVVGDAPAVEGVAGLRPWKENASVFCYKTKALKALTKLVLNQSAHRVIISYSDDGHIDLNSFIHALEPYGYVKLVEISTISRYRPNQAAVSKRANVKEYIIDFRKRMNNHE